MSRMYSFRERRGHRHKVQTEKLPRINKLENKSELTLLISYIESY